MTPGAIPLPAVLTVADVGADAVRALLGRFGIGLRVVPAGAAIPGSYWGAPEAGIREGEVFVRADTPVHSLLHETCHMICMCEERRHGLDTDAGGDDLEESAVCYLQVLLAGELAGAGRERVMRDMDAWGYSFRLGSTARWFREDADDARAWLARHGLVTAAGRPAFRLRNRGRKAAADAGIV